LMFIPNSIIYRCSDSMRATVIKSVFKQTPVLFSSLGLSTHDTASLLDERAWWLTEKIGDSPSQFVHHAIQLPALAEPPNSSALIFQWKPRWEGMFLHFVFRSSISLSWILCFQSMSVHVFFIWIWQAWWFFTATKS
jgi:hypothetical protein